MTDIAATTTSVEAASAAELIEVSLFFGSILAAVGVALAIGLLLRRRDAARVDAVSTATASTPEATVSAIATLVARAAQHVPAHRSNGPSAHGVLEAPVTTFDPLEPFGAGSRLTRSHHSTSGTITHGWVDTAALAGAGAGVVALARVRSTSTSRGASSNRTSTTWHQVTIARLPRPIAGSVHLERTDGQSFDPTNLGRVGEWLERSGLTDGLLTDPDLRSWFVGTTGTSRPDELNRLIAADEGLRSLLWSIRRCDAGSPLGSNARTSGYEAAIGPIDAGSLESISITGDLMILEAQLSPWRAGPCDRLVEVADHLAARFH